MDREENVNEMEFPTEERMEERPIEGQGASAVLGKFKDVDALAQAYESLQAEFTRRSQRLRQLERDAENFQPVGERSGAEKLRKTASARREEAKAFDAFVAEMTLPIEETADKPKACAPIEEPLRTEEEVGKVSAPLTRVEGGGREEVAERGENAMTPDRLFELATKDESVRLRIVGEYLASLGKTGAPLTGGGAGVLATPPTKAKTVGEAGNMALLYFRKPLAE